MMRETSIENFHFCPRCGGSLALRALEDGQPLRLACMKCAFVFYANPKVTVGVIATHQNGIVLLRRANEPAAGKWAFPGGFVDQGETVPLAAVRETKEEVGLEVRLSGLLDVYSYAGHDVIVVVYSADVVGGEFAPGQESLDIACFSPEDIPWDELAFPSTRDALRDYIRRFFPRVRLPR